jgi:hypothetical protein
MEIKVWINPEGQACWHPNWPVEPKQEDYVEYTNVGDLFHNDDYHSALYQYRAALESAKR